MSKKRLADKTRVHVRRCHICNGISEADGDAVKACTHCGKHMAPFYFYDDAEVGAQSDLGVRIPRAKGSNSPIVGLTAYW